MKSGIYETPNHNLILVRKDRTIAGTTLQPSTWPGTKVSHRASDDTVLIEGTDYRCKRVGDLRNGENRPANAVLAEFVLARDAAMRHHFDELDYGPATGDEGFERIPTVQLHGAITGRLHRGGHLPTAIVDGMSFLERAQGMDYSKLEERIAANLPVDVAKQMIFATGDPNPMGADERRFAILDGSDDAYRKWAENFRAALVAKGFKPGASGSIRGETITFDLSDGIGKSLKRQGFRICHKQSAAKHRRRGRLVIPMYDGTYAWRVA